MKNKNIKGFTLVELLAVIVILGVLIGIAFPSISSRIRETRNKTYSLHEADMKTAAMNLMSECVENGEECVPNGESRTYYLSELIARKYSEGLRDPENTDNYCDEEKSYVVVKNDSDSLSNFEYEICLVCSNYESGRCKEENNSDRCENIDDREGPDCGEVTGGSTIWTNSDRVISVGCKDKGGCGCSQDVYYKRFSETMEKGEIEIKDRKGNTTICPVNVYIDKNAPECELEVIGTMGENGWYGNEAPIVRFKSKTDSESGIESYGLGTSSKEYNFNREDKYTVTRGITNVYGYVRDNAGNVGVCSTVSIPYDDVPPTMKVRYGYQVYPKEDMASVSGNTISINNITSEYGTIYGAYIYFNGNVSGNSSISNGSTKLVSRTLSGVDKMEYKFTEGKYNNIKITVPNVSSVKRVELLTGEVNKNYYTNKNVTIYLDSHDSYSGKAYYTFDNEKTYQKDNYKTYTQNTSGIVVGLKDYAGNKSEKVTTAINNIDKVVPNCSITRKGDTINVEDWYRSNIDITLDKADKTGGVIRYYNLGTVSFTNNEQYNISSSSNGKYNNLDKGTQSVDTSEQKWYGYVIDKAGNISNCDVMTRKDTTLPTCKININGTPGNNGWYKEKAVTLTLDPKDLSGSVNSGVHRYGLSTSSTVDYNSVDKKIQGNTDNNGVAWYGYVEDKAGNKISCQPNTINTANPKVIKVDSTPPSCTLSKSHTGYTDGVTLTLTCSDSESKLDYTTNYSGSLKWTSFPVERTGIKTEGKDSETWYHYTYDKAGNKTTNYTTVYRTTQYQRRTRTWNNCLTGKNTCSGGWSYTAWESTGSSGDEFSSSQGTCSSHSYVKDFEKRTCYEGASGASGCGCDYYKRSSYWNSCKTGSNTCKGGWNSWSSWTGWSTSNNCSGYSSGSCESNYRYLYS